MAEARCRSCRVPIEWVRTTSGKRIPLDIGEHPGGNIVLVDGVAHYVSADHDTPRRRTHFATCPHAADHRRRA